MDFKNINTQLVDWDAIEGILHNGERGTTHAKEIHIGNSRVCLSEYSDNYKSAQWCEKAHVIYCVSGTMTIELKNGDKYTLTEGNSLVLGDEDHHIAMTGDSSAKIFVVD